MTADFAAGGFGRIVGDMVSDALGIPEKAGESGDAPAPSKMPSDSKVEETIASIENDERYSKILKKESTQTEGKKRQFIVNAENVNKRIEEMKMTIERKEEELNKIPGFLEQEKRRDTSIINQMYERLREYEALKEAKGFNDGGSIKIGAQDFRDLAYIVSGEAARNTNDEYGVAAAVLNRVASPVWPNTVRRVGFQAGQFEAVYTGKAKDEPKLAEKLASPKGQSSIASAMRLLNGRTDFKGQSMLRNKGASDIMFDSRGNFFHYTSQRRKNDPAPQNPSRNWKKLIGPGGPPVDLSTTSAPVGSVEEKEKKQKQEMNPLKALFKMLNIDFGENSVKNNSKSTSQISSPSTQSSAEKLKTPAQISSSPSPALSAAKSNITKTSQTLPYQKIKSKPVTKVAVLIKENTRNIIT
jgi:spore germination cell wall hydrolase CwlJ-like protein